MIRIGGANGRKKKNEEEILKKYISNYRKSLNNSSGYFFFSLENRIIDEISTLVRTECEYIAVITYST